MDVGEGFGVGGAGVEPLDEVVELPNLLGSLGPAFLMDVLCSVSSFGAFESDMRQISISV